jgi:hypothetical protein
MTKSLTNIGLRFDRLHTPFFAIVKYTFRSFSFCFLKTACQAGASSEPNILRNKNHHIYNRLLKKNRYTAHPKFRPTGAQAFFSILLLEIDLLGGGASVPP